jgi:hypothetical protein
MKCNIMQRQYCSAQIAYNNMRMMEQMTEQISSIREELEVLKKNGGGQEESLINPIGK